METDDEASSEDKSEELLPPTVLEAETVYVVMGYNYRISRNRRAEWFFSMINTVIKVKPLVDLADLSEELTIVSVIPKISDVEWGPESMTSYSYKICSETNINFLALKYRLVFCLDISPSVASVDVQAGLVMFDGIYHALHSSIENLVKPFRIPGSLVELEPRIYLTVIAHTPFLAPVADQVLVQGMAVTPQTVDEVLNFIFGKLAVFETKVAEVTASVTQTAEDEQARHHRMLGSAKDGMDRIVADNVAISSDFGFVDLLRQAIIALHLLPENSNAGIIVVTDGVISVPDGAFLDVILSQLRYNAVPCSFIQLSSPFHPHLCYGTIPYADFMRFVANATFGTYFTSVPEEISTDTFEMNVFQQAFLSWSFLKVWEDMKMNIASTIKPGEWSVRNKCFFSVRDMPIVRKQQYETNLSVDYLKVLSCRLREGFTIRDVHISSDTAEIKLSLPWKFLNHIEYTVTTAIPSQTKVTCSVSVEGPYDFLHDLTCLAKKPFDSYYRQLMVNRFWTMQKFLSESDKLLVHFNSFSTDPAYYNVPDSLRDGVPLFYMQTSSTIPVISSSEFSSSQNQSSKFAQFWKPVCMLDTSIWQKWMHTHSIRMLLEHDSPLPISLHVPNTSGRYQVIQCRQAVMALNTFLKNWSSFVLVENSSYVKLMSHDSDKPPFSFYVIRVTSKPPFVVLRLAFLVGTPGNLRHEVVTTIREGLCQLSCLQRLKDPPQDWKSLTQSTNEGLQENTASRSPKKSWQVLCCTILQKPLEKILIRYERVPRNLLYTLLPQASYYNVASPKSHAHQQSTFGFRPMFYTPWGSTIKMGPEMFNTVARYLHHKRWIWRIQNSSTRSLSLNCASQILSTLEKIRMQEGFQFAYSASGMASLVMELQMAPKGDSSTSLTNSCDGNIVPCVLQYVVFPPVNTLSSMSDEEDDVESESVEESGDLFVVSECWIEPQSGTVMENKQKDFSYMTGCEFTDIPVKIFEVDKECISTLVTFEHLRLMCTHETVPSPLSQPNEDTYGSAKNSCDIRVVPFAFDLNRILPKSQQAEIRVSMLIQDLRAVYPLNRGGRVSSFYDHANKALYDKLVENMASIHDREVALANDKNADILDMLVENQKGSIAWSTRELDTNAPGVLGKERKAGAPRLKCFIKKLPLSSSHVVLTVLPATFEDLKKLMLPGDEGGNERSSDNSVFFLPDKSDSCENRDCALEHMLEQTSFDDYLDDHSGHQLTSTPLTGAKEDCKDHDEKNRRGSLSALAGRKRSRVKSGGESGPCAKRPLKRVTAIDESFRLRAGSMETSWRSRNIMRSRTKSADDKNILQQGLVYDVHETRSISYGVCESWTKANGILSQESLMSPSPVENQKPLFGSIAVPIFSYDCSLSQVIDQIVKRSVSPSTTLNFDYRVHREDSVCWKQADIEVDTTASEDDESEVSKIPEESIGDATANIPTENSLTLMSLCSAVEMAWKKSYVYGIYESLQRGLNVHPTDVQVAISMCQEFRIEINLTDFLKTVCRHVNGNHHDMDGSIGSKHSGGQGEARKSLCIAMQRVHGFVKKRFTNILLSTFSYDSSSSDVFFLRLRDNKMDGFENESSKHTSDYEIESLTVKADSTCSESQGKDEEKSQHADSDEDDFFALEDYILQTPGSSSVRVSEDKTKSVPLFLQLQCSISTGQKTILCNVKEIPTCLEKLISDNGADIDLIQDFSSELKIELQFVFLTAPADVENIQIDFSGRVRTLSTCSTSSAPTPVDEQPPRPVGGSQSLHSSCETSKKLPHLPALQLQSVKRTVENVQWLLRDEITSCLSSSEIVEESTLKLVAGHVKSSLGKPGCQSFSIPLNFVNKAYDRGYEKFRQRFTNLVVDEHSLKERQSWFYIVGPRKAVKMTKEWNENVCISASASKNQPPSEESDAGTTVSTQGDGCAAVNELSSSGMKDNTAINEASELKNVETNSHSVLLKTHSQLSEVSTAVESLLEHEDEYDGDRSESGHEEVNDEEISFHPRSPPFWLIFRLHPDQIQFFFHCRYDEDDLSIHTYASKLMEKVVNAVTALRRTVNQDLLLQQLHDTRQCSPLLEPESDEIDIWETREAFTLPTSAGPLTFPNKENSQETPLRTSETNSDFAPGSFSCKIVWETKFVLHSRLRTGPSKSVISRGIQTLRTTLIAFEVSNRKNMFVYRDSSGNVFYLRLYRTHGCSSPNSSDLVFPDGFGDGSEEMRMVGSLLKESSKEEISQNRTQSEDVVLLQVHGIAEAGTEIKEQLVQSLRNKLDDSVLDILSVTLERNPHCKLTPEDVHFIQRPNSQPDSVFKYGVNPFANQLLPAFAFYIHQNILQFLHLPKYTDTKPENRFQDYTRIVDNQSESSEKSVYLYNQSPGGTGSRGIACLSINLVDRGGVVIHGGEACRPSSDAFTRQITVTDFPELISCEEICGDNETLFDTFLEVKLWKQGRINMDLLKSYLLTAMKHCLWDLHTEFYFLTAPVFSLSSSKIDSLSSSEPSTPMVVGMFPKHEQSLREGPLSGKFIGPSVKQQCSTSAVNGMYDIRDLVRSSLERRNSANLPASVEKSDHDIPRVRSMSVSARKPSLNLDGKLLGRAPSPVTFSAQALQGTYKTRIMGDSPCGMILRSEPKDFGQLHPIYGALMKEWCDFGNKLAAPSLRLSSISLNCRHDPGAVAQEVEKVVLAIAPDNTPRQFWKYDQNDSSLSMRAFGPGTRKVNSREEMDNRLRGDAEFKLLKKQLKYLKSFEKQNEIEYPADLAQLFRNPEEFNPRNQSPECIIISRNLLHWKMCVASDFPMENVGFPEVPKNCYKFQPLYYGGSDLHCIGGSPSSTSLDKLSRVSSSSQIPSSAGESELVINNNPVLVPRQRLLIVHTTSSQIRFVFYNWSKETSDRLLEQAKCVALWSNARSGLFSSIFAQKAGMFAYQAIQDTVPLPTLSQDGNPFLGGVVDTYTLICNRGPPKEYHLSRLANLKKTKQSNSLSNFLECCRNLKHAAQIKAPDPNVPHAHGEQLVDNKLMDKKESQNTLFQHWLLRGLSASNMIGYDAIHSYKQVARVMHYVMTPILFLSRWRAEVAATRDSTIGTFKKGRGNEVKKLRAMQKAVKDVRSRHNSGASQRSSEGKSRSKSSMWGLWGSSSSTSEPLSHAISGSTTSLISSKKVDEKWHSTLCDSFVQEYIQYLQTLGFMPIQSKNVNRQRIPSKKDLETERNRHFSGASFVSMHSSGSSQSGGSQGPSTYGGFSKRQREESGERIMHYLQKSLPGGILLFECGLVEPFFFAKLYALEAARIQPKKNKQDIHQSTMDFLAHCEKIKTTMHLHSFSYDFHLRAMHGYLSGKHLIFKQGYHLTNFLLDFIKYYPKGPNFARNIVHVGAILVQNVAAPSHILYNYIVDHDKLYGMNVVRMSILHPENFSDMVNEFVLTQVSSRRVVHVDTDVEGQPDELDLTLLICHDVHPLAKPYSMDPSVLRLKFYIILTSRRELYPKIAAESKNGKLSIVNVPEAIGHHDTGTSVSTSTTSEPASAQGSRRASISDTMMSLTMSGIGSQSFNEQSGSNESLRKVADKQYEGIFEEKVNYVGYFSSHEQMMQSIMQEQVAEVENDIRSIVKQAAIDCRRDMLWKRLICGGFENDRTRNRKEDLIFRETSGALTYWEFTELLELIVVRSLTEMDPRLVTLMTQPMGFYKNLIDLLAVKHKNNHRFYVAPDNTSYQMAIYSPKVLNCAVLLDICGDTADLRVIFKELPAAQDGSLPSADDSVHLDHDVLDLIESVVNACCYCCWARCVDSNMRL